LTKRWVRRAVPTVGMLFALYVGAGPLGVSNAGGSPVALVASKSATARTKPLVGPKTTPTQDTTYLSDVAKADPALTTYIAQRGNVALRALLTDGAAFCAFLQRGGGIDNAILSVAEGAKSVESATHLPAKIATFNTMESVALLTLCPSDQKLVPAAVRAKLRVLAKNFAK
jgi:hypothetical protein